MGSCPECMAQVSLSSKPRIGEIMVCAECQSELEIVGLNPVELAVAPEIEEDWGE